MTTSAWLGYTPITSEANANLRKLWHKQQLPATSFEHWSLEFAREVWQAVVDFAKDAEHLDREELVTFLSAMGVWDEDQQEQQWVPRT